VPNRGRVADDGLLASLEAQVDVDRADGATMALHDCGAAQALAMLRAESTQEHLALGDVARRILRELHLPPE